jgi:large subunit ribosomal protein L15
MKYHELQTNSTKSKKRVGRGISSGQGKTAGRGTKGQNSRTGSRLRVTFMGGQGSLVQRIPKRKGFKSLRAPAQTVYVDELEALKNKTADNQSLYQAGLIGSPFHRVKIIARGELAGKVTVKTQAASKGAIEAIQKAGGSFEKAEVALVISTTSKKSKEKQS